MRKNTKLLCGLFGASLVLAMGLTFAIPETITSSADGAFFTSSSNVLPVEAYNSSNIKLTNTTGSVKVGATTYNYYTTYWKDVSYFTVSLPSDISKSVVSNNELILTVNWIPEEVSGSTVDFETDKICTGTIFSKTFETLDSIPSTYKIYIDNLGEEDAYKTGEIIKDKDDSTNTYLKNGGWGIYQFSISINTVRYSSNLVEVKPTALSSIDTAQSAEILEKAVRSKYSINNAYDVTFKDPNSPFYYVKRNFIKWHVEGEGSDGQDYVLLPSQIKDEKTKSLLTTESADYVGSSMNFDFDVSGTWSIYCEIVDPTNPEITWTSNSVTFSTVKKFPINYIIWIIVGSVLLAGITLSVIIAVSKKKEKNW